MKKLLIATSFLLSLNVYAQDACVEVLETKDINTPTPESLKDATILVKQKDGTVKEMSANEFKVVPRKQQFITKSRLDCSKKEAKKNRLSLVGGFGPSGVIGKSVSATSARLEAEAGPHGGLQYQRLLTERFSVGIQGLSNRSGSLLLGLDF